MALAATVAGACVAQQASPAAVGGGGATRAPAAVTPSDKIEALRAIPLFKYLDYKELVTVLNIISMRGYDAGQDVVVEGDVRITGPRHVADGEVLRG